ncbi:MAG TPA: zf-HC2 domain-containing protein [Candidatus Polarisedimenticolia bacterium]|nr:zf-HC2 domain-containing protein [Candidatus Polarisedimenticolia bacterium]
MIAGADHPILLPWFVSGKLDDETAADVSRHLTQCDVCRREVDALASMQGTLRRHGRTDHLPIADLVAYEELEATAAGTGAVPAHIAAHLVGCSTCASELEALRAARRELGAMGPETPDLPARATAATRSPRWRLAFFAAAAAALVLLVPALRGVRPVPNLPGPGEIHPVRLMAQTRGDEAEAMLPENGPWVIEVLLPFGAPAGEYDVRIAARGEAATGITVHARATPDGTLGLFLPALPPGNHFEIRAMSAAAAGTSYTYAVARGDAP